MTQYKGIVPVLFAIGGNFIVALLKLFAYFVSGSSALFSEAIHSFADTANQSLLLFGIMRSRKKADAQFSYGYGSERFLWALISACGIFFLGAGATIYHGVSALYDAHTPHLDPIIFGILGVSFVVESFTLYTAVRELRRDNKESDWREALSEGDPATIAVIYEDGVAVIGILIALLGTGLTYLTGNSVWDAIASIGVGVSLAGIAIILINKNRSFLIGKSINAELQEEIIEQLLREPCIEKVIDFRSTILDIGHYHIKCDVEWNGSALLTQIVHDDDMREDYERVSESFAEFHRYVAYTANRIPRLIGRTIDDIEKRIVAKYPQIDHIDIEIN